MKKIKSVKLKREYRDTSHIMTEGQYGVKWFDEEEKETFWKFGTQRTDYSFCENTITGNKTDLFEIEYEEEIKYIDVRIEFENEDYTDSWKPAMIRYIERTLNNNFIMTKNFKVTELESKSKEYEEIIDERKNL